MPILATEASRAFVPPCTQGHRPRAAALGPALHGGSRNPSRQLGFTAASSVPAQKPQYFRGSAPCPPNPAAI